MCLNQVVRNVAAVLRAGARVYVRGYSQGDLAQPRLSRGPRPQQLAPDFYLRMDGTRAYYFTQAGAVLGLPACHPRTHPQQTCIRCRGLSFPSET